MDPDSSAPVSRGTIRLGRLALIAFVLIATAGGTAWYLNLLPGSQAGPRENALMVIAPYRHEGTWGFDDPSVGLVKEPFVAGVPEMIDILVTDIPDAEQGFRLLSGSSPFPGYQKKLTWLRGDMGGNYYSLDEPPMEGWICPAMFKYYAKAPENLYVRAEPIR